MSWSFAFTHHLTLICCEMTSGHLPPGPLVSMTTSHWLTVIPASSPPVKHSDTVLCWNTDAQHAAIISRSTVLWMISCREWTVFYRFMIIAIIFVNTITTVLIHSFSVPDQYLLGLLFPQYHTTKSELINIFGFKWKHTENCNTQLLQ